MTGAPTKPGLERAADGELVGRDPRGMSADEVREVGHEPMSAQKALRLRCLDCCAGSSAEVRLCVAVKCPSWPFRMGKSPWKAPRALSDEHKAALAAARQKPVLVENEREDAAGAATETAA